LRDKILLAQYHVISSFGPWTFWSVSGDDDKKANHNPDWRLLPKILLYCRLCLTREQQLYAKSGNGHISRVKSYGRSSTTTLRDHLRIEHKIADTQAQSEANHFQPKLTFKTKLENFQPFSTQFELNRDLSVWACLDLESFMFTQKDGMKFFFEKNFPSVKLPSRNTLSRAGVHDVYDSVVGKIKDALADLRGDGGAALGLMFDGWSDRYKRYPYLGLRVSYVDRNWTYRVVTLSFKVVERHTSDRMSSYVREELQAFGVDLQSFMLFTTHDGAANMMKASQMLRSDHTQHCVAHALHLLLVTDGINQVPEIVELLHRCKAAVIKLDNKGCIVEKERTKSQDREFMDDLLDKIAHVTHVLNADETISDGIPESSSQPEFSGIESDVGHHSHKTLKQSCITRWSSILTMVDSVLCLWTEMNEALKSNGDRDYCLTEDDRLILGELKTFLQPFAELTELVSCEQPHLGLIPLIVAEVKDATKYDVNESECITSLKLLVAQRLPHRIKITDAVRIATLLDPSSKHIIAADVETEDIKQLLIEHTKQTISRTTAASNLTSTELTAENSSTDTITTGSSGGEVARKFQQCQSVQPQQPSKKLKLLQKASQSASSGMSGSMEHKIEREVNTYVHLEVTDHEENPLVFWKKQEHNYPNLSLLAKCYLSISASSVPVEAMFSTCGLILNSKRSSMSPYRANMISVIHDNYAKFFPITRAAALSMTAADTKMDKQ